jgi:hypothetical protein
MHVLLFISHIRILGWQNPTCRKFQSASALARPVKPVLRIELAMARTATPGSYPTDSQLQFSGQLYGYHFANNSNNVY